MQKTIEQLEKEINELNDELSEKIDENKSLRDDIDNLEYDLKEKNKEISYLEDEIEDLRIEQQDYDLQTVIGNVRTKADNLVDEATIDLFDVLICNVRPQQLQDDLKQLIVKYNIQTTLAK